MHTLFMLTSKLRQRRLVPTTTPTHSLNQGLKAFKLAFNCTHKPSSIDFETPRPCEQPPWLHRIVQVVREGMEAGNTHTLSPYLYLRRHSSGVKPWCCFVGSEHSEVHSLGVAAVIGSAVQAKHARFESAG